MHAVSGSPLAERLAEVIEEFSECNQVSVADVLEALEYTYACVERFSDDTTAEKLS